MKVNINNLVVTVGDKIVLNGLNLLINDGETHVIMGPNGVGKSTLSKVIMGHKDYQIRNGSILIDNKETKGLETDEIARLGVFLSFQNPISIEGVSISEFLRSALNAKENKVTSLYDFVKKINASFDELAMDRKMMHRSINENFSGGERKKNEILQMKILEPKFIILDELDSGLDVDSLKIVTDSINEYLSTHKDTSVLIITHYPKILEYLKPDYVHVLENGKIIKTGDISLAKEIEEKGYKFLKNSESLISGD